MSSISQVERSLKYILEERANVLARETGCIERQRKFSGADLLQTLVFGWLSHPDASRETLASVATLREVKVTDTAVHKRFTQACAHFLHAILEEMTGVVVEADWQVPLELINRFEAIVLEDSSTVALPNELVKCWQGCGGAPGEGHAAVPPPGALGVKTRESSPGQSSRMGVPVIGRVLSKRNHCLLGVCISRIWASLPWGSIAARRAAGSYTLTRAQARTLYWTVEGKPLKLDPLLPHQVGQTKERMSFGSPMSTAI